MDDSKSKWEIQEYSCSKSKSKEEEEDSESESLVSWMVRFGRDMMITISCAQLGVLSSSMGVAFAVFYASYACTTNILTFLLPLPLPIPPHNNNNNYINVVQTYETEQQAGQSSTVDQETEIEIVTEPMEEEDDRHRDYDLQEHFSHQVDNNHFLTAASNVVFQETPITFSASKDAIFTTHLIHLNLGDDNLLDERITNNNFDNFQDIDGADDDQGYEEDVGEYMQGDDDGLHEEWKVKEPLVASCNDKNENNTHEVDEHVKLRDQGWVGNRVEDDGVVGGRASNVDFGDARDIETTKPVTVKEVEVDSHKLVDVGNKNEERLSEMHRTMICDGNNLSSSELYTLNPVTREVIGDADKDERIIKFDEQLVAGSCPSTDGSEDAVLRTMEEYLIHSNVEARVISDKNLFCERSTDNNLGNLEGYEEDAGEDDGLEEEQKGKHPSVESWSNEDAKLRDEMRVDTVEDDHVTVSGSSSDVVFGDVETTKPVIVKHADSQKLVEVGNKNEEHVCELRHKVVLANENNLSSREVYTLDLVAREVIRDADKDERTIKFDETVVRKSSASMDGTEYTVLRTIEEHLIHSVEDARAIGDESLLDERKTNYLESLEVGYEVKENIVDDNVVAFARSPPSERDTDNDNKVKENVGDADVNVLACSPSKHDMVNAKVVCMKMPPRGENMDVDDEKIWEKIRAMKTIVGYNAPSQSTCIGELKALYVFTGVEPPASFEGDSDLDAKLKFLMAIVGVK